MLPQSHDLYLSLRATVTRILPMIRRRALSSPLSRTKVSDWEDAKRSLSDGDLGHALLAQVSASIAVEKVSRPLVRLSLMYA